MNRIPITLEFDNSIDGIIGEATFTDRGMELLKSPDGYYPVLYVGTSRQANKDGTESDIQVHTLSLFFKEASNEL